MNGANAIPSSTSYHPCSPIDPISGIGDISMISHCYEFSISIADAIPCTTSYICQLLSPTIINSLFQLIIPPVGIGSCGSSGSTGASGSSGCSVGGTTGSSFLQDAKTQCPSNYYIYQIHTYSNLMSITSCSIIIMFADKKRNDWILKPSICVYRVIF